MRFIRPLFAAICLLAAACHAQELKPWRGGAAPALALPAAGGARVDLADLRGKVVALNFWATWCEPCVEEMPSLARLQAQMAAAPFAVLAVDMGESEEKVAEFLERLKLDLRILFDHDSSATRRWKVGLLPATFLIDADGRIRYWQLGGAEWDSPRALAAVRALLPPPAR